MNPIPMQKNLNVVIKNFPTISNNNMVDMRTSKAGLQIPN
jgi:hypothetical protein